MKKQFAIFLLLYLQAASIFASTFVQNSSDLKAAIEKATPGDTIILKNGVWESIQFGITTSGTKESPIVLMAQTSSKVSIQGNSKLQIGGNWWVIEGLVFEKGYSSTGHPWTFTYKQKVANNCRVTNCTIIGFNNPNRMQENHWVALYGKNNRVDHCKFIDKTNLGVLMAVIMDDERSRNSFHRIDHNYFGVRRPLGSNGGEIIRVGVSEHCTFNSNTSIEENYFDNCDGETEIISIKSCGNEVRKNVFKECQGAVVLRHGNNNIVFRNYFLGNGKLGTGGVRVINEGNWVVENYFYRCTGDGFRAPLAIMNGVFNSPPNRYLPVRDAVIANNQFDGCAAITIGEGSDKERTVAPKNVFLLNNTFTNTQLQQTVEVHDTISEVYVAPSFNLARIPTGTIFPKPSLAAVDSIQQLALKKLNQRLPNIVGAPPVSYFQSLEKSLSILVAKAKPVVKTIYKRIECADATALYHALENSTLPLQLVLTGTNYHFTKSIQYPYGIQLKGLGKVIQFSSADSLTTLFRMNAEQPFELSNLQLQLEKLPVQNFIGADSNGTVTHFSVKINNCTFTKSILKNWIAIGRNAYADSVVFNANKFTNTTGTILSGIAQIENKGLYSLEKLVVLNNYFTAHSGQIIDLYRGGNDESTMGPRIQVQDNVFTSCTSNNPLLSLTGVQYSLIANNKFNQCLPKTFLIRYTDIVKAKHVEINNTINQ